ncbi:MAG: 3-deoxy-D-manno-octulosonic acid transferase [Ignavibacteriales bacterium]|nr:3-deoxy-D-manno-octulosonic acid transferase [Ignavibacteriales bacterium]
MNFWSVLYNVLIVPIGWLAFHLLSLFDKKVKRGIDGRKNLFENLQRDVQRLRSNAKRIWFHSSSMGEFEQAKPIIAELKKRYPEVEIVVSFFSPSGYDHSKNYKLADVICYLPFDSRRNAERFLSIIQPTAAVMVRYDVWPNHLWQLKQKNIPIFIANATFRNSWLRNLPFIHNFFYQVYNSIDNILTVSEQDKQGFQAFQLQHPQIEAIGDTRFDQVWRRSAESRTRHVLPNQLVDGKKVVVIGSSWLEDEEVLFPALIECSKSNENLLTVLVPHEPDEQTLERIEFMLNGTMSNIRLSSLADYKNERVIVVDSIGVLMALYQYAHVAYVGGSFRQGIHNVLEPAVYGVPLLFGPKHENSQEAVQLVKQEAAFVVSTSDEAQQLLNKCLNDEVFRQRAGTTAREFVERNIGATGRFLTRLAKVL